MVFAHITGDMAAFSIPIVLIAFSNVVALVVALAKWTHRQTAITLELTRVARAVESIATDVKELAAEMRESINNIDHRVTTMEARCLALHTARKDGE